ncbi:1-acyl-sn-glycerol-3-phosphate acyltransferase [Luteolibacter ambystomatis]|uniref:1-acyl-sn-glycerol-3-phosphate acyltransferase n=1 Tax=Luteolibacter ambystomatis TaxID=2824561 RepID=A0A975G6H6_9BACT|nr:lysophospholipid acyltransferase family protein [Luteolibacter ambystomatis]QUE49671.1 1-acyl-sn-glycerol-3-phosphate acyltransferase [Luteolibacter ambystomatis]
MRELPQDRPYRFRPPVDRPWLNPLLRWVNRRVFLKWVYNVEAIECHGIEALRSAMDAGDAVVLAPNHADHADVHVLSEVTARIGIRPRFMGAREIFEAGALNSFALQSGGVFSVDRDGADIAAIKMALSILEEGKYPLVIYPEGEIYHHHEWLDPLHDGLASILLKVARKLPAPRRARIFPIAFRFEYDGAVRETFPERIAALEKTINWSPKEDLPMVERLYCLGPALLAAKEMEFFGETEAGTLAERLERLRERLLEDVESRHGKDARAETVPERVRGLRSRIRRALLDPEKKPSPSERARMLDDIRRIHVAYQVYSYPGVYLAEDPDDHRIAETLMKLEEDLLGKATYPVARRARIVFGEPIDVTALLESGALPQKGGALELTALLEDKLGTMVRGGEPQGLSAAERPVIVSAEA